MTGVQGQPGLHSVLKASHGYRMRPFYQGNKKSKSQWNCSRVYEEIPDKATPRKEDFFRLMVSRFHFMASWPYALGQNIPEAHMYDARGSLAQGSVEAQRQARTGQAEDTFKYYHRSPRADFLQEVPTSSRKSPPPKVSRTF